MNDEFEKNEAEKGADEKRQTEKQGRRTKGVGGISFSLTMVMLSLVFVALYAIVNVSSIATVASRAVSILTPVILGFGIAYLLNPLMKFFEKRIFRKIKNKKILRVLGLTCTYITVALFLCGVAFLIAPALIESITVLIKNFDGYIEHTIDLINGLIEKYLDTHDTVSVDREQLFEFIAKLFNTSGDLFQSVGEYVIKYGTGLVVGAKNLLFALFISIYVLFSKENLKAYAQKLATAFLRSGPRHRLYKYVKLCNKTFGGFFIGKIIDSLIIGAITFVTLYLFRMPFFELVAAIVCVTNIIPVFGPFIGAIPSFFIIFIKDPSKAFLFLVIILVIQQIDGNIIGPKILGNSTGMSSLGVMVAILVMGEWLGVIGMILGVPIFAVVIAIINEIAEHKLRQKNMPVNTAEYYADAGTADLYEKKETFSHAIFSFAGSLFGKLFKLVFRRGGSSQTENAEAEEKQEEQEDNRNED